MDDAPPKSPSTQLVPAPAAPLSLPVRSAEVLAGLSPRRALELEHRHGNGDLARVLDILGIGGPLRAISPWELEDETGRHLIHAGGYAASPFGEAYPPLVDFMREYLERNRIVGLPQQSISDWRAALETNLVHLLASVAPEHADSQVFLTNSGAEAVEAALKFARASRPDAPVFLNFERGYHGKTFGALSVTPNEEYQAPFRPLLGSVETLPYGDAEAFARALDRIGPKRVAAVVLEPVQGEGGVIVPPPDFLPAVQRLAREHGVLVIADEVQSGLGRSGHLFASVAGGLVPDILCLAKPLGGGLVPIGATIARRGIYRRMLGGLESKRHSSTFGGGSLAAAVALRSLEIIVDEGLVERSRDLGERGLTRLRELQARYPGYIGEVRGAGTLFAVQLRNVLKPWLVPGQEELLRQLGTALALRTLHLGGLHVCYTLNASHVVRLTPPMNQPDAIFDEMFRRLERVARGHRNAWTMLPRMPLTRLLRLARLALD